MNTTAMTRLFTQGCDEQLVCELTGNTSEVVNACKHTSNVMQKDISIVQYGNNKKQKTQPSSTVSKSPDKTKGPKEQK